MYIFKKISWKNCIIYKIKKRIKTFRYLIIKNNYFQKYFLLDYKRGLNVMKKHYNNKGLFYFTDGAAAASPM